MSDTQSRKIRILVVGSGRADQPDFVHGLLNGFDDVFDIGCIISGPFSGADSYARNWAQEKNVPYEMMDIADKDRMALSFFDSHRQIPLNVMRNDPMFAKGFESLRRSAPDAILAIPAPDGNLGPTTACLTRMASVLGIQIINGADAMREIEARLQDAVSVCSHDDPGPQAPARSMAPA